MNTKIETNVKITLESFCYKIEDEKDLLTHPVKVGDFYGYETCKYFNVNKSLRDITIPEGEYKVTITLEK